jgi:hypothetical protein
MFFCLSAVTKTRKAIITQARAGGTSTAPAGLLLLLPIAAIKKPSRRPAGYHVATEVSSISFAYLHLAVFLASFSEICLKPSSSSGCYVQRQGFGDHTRCQRYDYRQNVGRSSLKSAATN